MHVLSVRWTLHETWIPSRRTLSHWWAAAVAALTALASEYNEASNRLNISFYVSFILMLVNQKLWSSTSLLRTFTFPQSKEDQATQAEDCRSSSTRPSEKTRKGNLFLTAASSQYNQGNQTIGEVWSRTVFTMPRCRLEGPPSHQHRAFKPGKRGRHPHRIKFPSSTRFPNRDAIPKHRNHHREQKWRHG